ncbi:MAG: methylaspartate mutase [Coxiella sp. (in: Bacteria)]|nr:MAG: methylaspartate mutase [Coxiella sp. (in: g-proteobacteria)]
MSISFSTYVDMNRKLNQLIVQPRMGFGKLTDMGAGLKAVYQAQAPTIGTITLDSYTRVNKYEDARKALRNNEHLNGFPIVTHGAEQTKELLGSITDKNDFSVQVRHGTALPRDIFKTIIQSNIDATEGGPISYCLPYSRVAIKDAIQNWIESCHIFSNSRREGYEPHIESFAGCMLGQLCPPSLLIALGVLEGLFFKCYGINSVSLSYAQCINPVQDITAIAVLKKLGAEFLSGLNWHTVMYGYMGVFPTSLYGSIKLISDSAQIAKFSKCERLIVKTPLEAYRIPTIEENVASLEMAYAVSEEGNDNDFIIDEQEFEVIYTEARSMIDAVLNIDDDLSKSLPLAFKKGLLDVPYCLHVENSNQTRCYIDEKDYLKWADVGNLPIKNDTKQLNSRGPIVTSDLLLEMLMKMRTKYDGKFYKNTGEIYAN